MNSYKVILFSGAQFIKNLVKMMEDMQEEVSIFFVFDTIFLFSIFQLLEYINKLYKFIFFLFKIINFIFYEIFILMKTLLIFNIDSLFHNLHLI